MSKRPIEPHPAKVDLQEGIYRTANALVGAVPTIGSGLQALLETSVGSPLRRRQEAWYQRLAEKLNDVCERVEDVNPERLAQNEAFLDAVVAATGVAMRNHHEEKLKALAQIVSQEARGQALDTILRNTFIDLVDRWSPTHFLVLRAIAKELRPTWKQRGIVSGSIGMGIDVVKRETGLSHALAEEMIRDLHGASLIEHRQYEDFGKRPIGSRYEITDRGKIFIRYAFGEDTTSQRHS